MPYCPVCRGEYRRGFSRCAVCEVDLVESLEQARPAMDDAAMAEYLAGKEAMVLAKAPWVRLKDLKSLLCSQGVANMVIRDPACCATKGCTPTLELAVAVEDAERAMAILRVEFEDLVGTVCEDEAVAGRLDREVALGTEGVRCPACDASIPPGVNECPECGLNVGVPEELLAEEADEK